MKNTLLIIACFFSLGIQARERFQVSGVTAFIENKGQIIDQHYQSRNDIQFQLKAVDGLTIFIGNGALHYQFTKADKQHGLRKPKEILEKRHQPEDPVSYTMYRMDVELVGVNKNAQVIKEDKQGYYENYYTPGTGENGATAHAFAKIVYKDIYPNIDWVLYTRNNELKHEFIVRPGGNLKNIKLQYKGAINLTLNQNGSLTAITPFGTVTEQAPVSFTKNGRQVRSGFVLKDDVVGYEVAGYEGVLVIDPSLSWATYFGGSGSENSDGIATDANGNVYITGKTGSLSNFATAGAHQTTYNGPAPLGDAFVAKFTSTGSLVWASYYGGAQQEESFAITVDPSSNIYIAGHTFTYSNTSTIATTGAHQTTYGGQPWQGVWGDGFIAKFSATGTRLWGTYYGGTGDDYFTDITTDALGNVYATGGTSSTNAIATAGVYQSSLNGGFDLMLVKFSPSGTRLWGSYLGGINNENGQGVSVDVNGNVYVGGLTLSTGIATTGAFQTSYGGNGLASGDGFLAKFSTTGAIGWCTYYGGNDQDFVYDVLCSAAGDVYVCGTTMSTTGIASPGAFQTNNNLSFEDAMIAKFDSGGNRIWSTYYGGNGSDFFWNMSIDTAGNIVVGGYTGSTNNITTPNGYQTIIGVPQDAMLVTFNPSGVRVYGTYFGGNDDDWCYSVATDLFGAAYLSGSSLSSANIATPGAYQTTLNGTIDCFIAKFLLNTASVIVAHAGNDTTICGGMSAQIGSSSQTGHYYSWSSSPAGFSSILANPVVTPTGTTVYYLKDSVTNSLPGYDTVIVTVTPSPTATITASGTTTFCQGVSVVLTGNTGTGFSYQWQSGSNNITGATNNSFTATQSGTYKLMVTNSNNCSATSNSILVTVNPKPTATVTAGGPLTFCQGSNVQLTAATSAGYSYQWMNGSTAISGATNNSYTATQSGSYKAVVTNVNNCSDTSAVFTVVVNPMPVAAIAVQGNTSSCAGEPPVLLASTGAGYSYQWLQAGAPITGATDTSYTAIASGSYSVTVTLSTCSATSPAVAVNIFPQPVVTISEAALVLSASGSYSSYQWYLNGTPITGATSPTYTVTQNGGYYLVVTDGNNCTGQSNTLQVTDVGIPILEGRHCAVYPNPATDQIKVLLTHASGTLRLTDATGKVVKSVVVKSQELTVDLKGLASGVYLLQYKGEAGEETVKVVKE